MNEKEAAIQKINKIGKIGLIVSKIAQTLLIIGLVFAIAGTIACITLPKDLLNLKLNGQAFVGIDISNFHELTDRQQQDLRESFEESKHENKLYINDSKYSLNDYEVNEKGFNLLCDANLKTFNLRDLAKILLIATIYIAISIVTVVFIGRLCKALQNCQSPFEPDVIDKMQHFSFALIPWAFVSSFSSSLVTTIFSSDFDFNLGINFGIVSIVLIILALTYIFKYGSILQQESDETL